MVCPQFSLQSEMKAFLGCCKHKSTALDNTEAYIQFYPFCFTSSVTKGWSCIRNVKQMSQAAESKPSHTL